MSPRRIPRSVMLLALFGLSLALIAGCANSSTDAVNQAGDNPSANEADAADAEQNEVDESAEEAASDVQQEVRIAGSAFQPGDVTIKAGTIVVWTNEDSANHQVHDDSNAFKSDILGQGGTVEIAYSAPGTFTYHCHVHPNMTGTIVVE